VKIRAAVLEQFAAPLAITEVDLAEPKQGEALVRLEACGVCHTDLYTASGVDPSGYAPTVLGHEGAGIVETVGDGVSSVAPGDRVVTLFSPQCRECIHCRSPHTNLCLAIRDQQNQGYLPDGSTRLSLGGEPIRHFMGTSTFAEYTVMPEIALAKVSPEADADHACLFACGLSTGLGAAINTAKVTAGSTCVVFGAGMVGLGVAGKGETLDIVPRLLITGRRVCGSSFGGVKGRDQVPELVQLYLDGRLDVDPFISHRLSLDEVNRGFELMERQDGIRSVITF
jgi:S-(hydroxymethyl)glutathione dehydrogenase/alcohol dehydrogenase